jgi:hypothetical protein
VWGHARTLPIVQIVLQISISDAELQHLEELPVVHQVEGVEHVEVQLFGGDEGVVHQFHPRRLPRHVVERVGRLQRLVHRVVHHRRRQRVVADEVDDLALALHDEAVHDVRTRQEPVHEVFLGELGRQIELLQVLQQQALINCFW